MKRSLFVALMLTVAAGTQADARGFGGFGGFDGAAGYGIRGAGGLDANGIQGAGGLWGAGIHGAGGLGGEGLGVYGGFSNPYRGGGGFGNPGFARGGGSSLNAPLGMNQPPANFGQPRPSLGGASTLGLQTGGFRAGQFGPMLGSGQNSALSSTRAQTPQTAPGSNPSFGLPTDMGIQSSRDTRNNFGYTGSARGLSSFNPAAAGQRSTPAQRPQAGQRSTFVGPSASAFGSRAANAAAPRTNEGNVAARPKDITHDWSAADLRVQGNYIRGNFDHYNAFNRDWFKRHPAAWWGGYAAGAWSAANWADVNSWFGAAWPTYGYWYGTDLTYVGDDVCLYGQPIASADEYYQSAADLVQTGAAAQVPSQPQPSSSTAKNPANADWLPLGIFEAIPAGEKSSKMLMQLAVNKAGIIRGNYFNTGDENTQLIQGAVDKQTARVAWVVADKQDVVFDTGLYNLTQDESPILVHFGKDKNEQWTLVRLKQNDTTAAKK